MELYCLSCSRPLAEEIRDRLAELAFEMLASEELSRKIKEPDFEATIRTELEFVTLAGMGGVMFTADVSDNAGDTHVHFLFRAPVVEAMPPMATASSKYVH